MRRPGRNRPSLTEYSGKVEGRDEDFGAEARSRTWGNGEVAVAKSRVAKSSVLVAGLPQDEQKRMFADSSVPQKAQVDMKFPIQDNSGDRRRALGIRLRLGLDALAFCRRLTPSDARRLRPDRPLCITIQKR